MSRISNIRKTLYIYNINTFLKMAMTYIRNLESFPKPHFKKTEDIS